MRSGEVEIRKNMKDFVFLYCSSELIDVLVHQPKNVLHPTRHKSSFRGKSNQRTYVLSTKHFSSCGLAQFFGNWHRKVVNFFTTREKTYFITN